MAERFVVIDDEIFESFPDFKRGLVIVEAIENAEENAEIRRLMEEAMAGRVGGDFLKHDFILAWDEAHRKFGSNPNKYPPSVKALLKRVQKGKRVPFINCVVAAFNYISMKYLIPCGGDDVDRIVGNMRLGFATGDEIFVPLGGGEEEHPVPGEVIYYDDATSNVMCRRWNWRNGDFTKITPETHKMVINVDGVGVIPEDVVLAARDDLADLLRRACDAALTTDFLHSDRRSVEVGV